MRLFSVITIHDFAVLATDETDARATATSVIRAGEQRVYEQVAYEVTKERNLRTELHDDTPWVSANLPEYNPTEAETCIQLFTKLYSKR